MRRHTGRWAKAISVGLIGTLVWAMPTLAAQVSYTVQPNDTYWIIGNKLGVTAASLESANPGIPAGNLQVGETLTLPQTITTYAVKAGDTEWLISRRLNVSWTALQAANPGINPLNLQPGQVLVVPPSSAASTAQTTASTSTATNSDLYWLSRVIAAEATSQPLDAKLAVGAVVMNRTRSSYYASTVQGVIFQSINGHAQFTSVANGWIYNVTPTSEDITAAQEVLAGTDIVPSALVFYNASQTPASSWVFTQPTIAVYGALTFAS